MYKHTPIRPTLNFSGQKGMEKHIPSPERKKRTTSLVISAKLTFRNGEINTFQDNQKLR
jgi:hypothetical protein